MESNGEPGRIHCSQATADALKARGKGLWLTPREEKVVAKGKGELQTYWIESQQGASGSTGWTTMSATSTHSAQGQSPDELQERLFARLSSNSSHRA